MGITKTESYSERQIRLAGLAKAMGHPARWAILEHLARVNSCICGDLVDELPLSQPTVSQHLKELKQAGLIRGTVEGNAICYCIDARVLGEYLDELGRLRDRISSMENNCC
jgi:DNA-binding transcriptional ArsR family regulator